MPLRRPLQFEHRTQPMATRRQFVGRMLMHALVSGVLVAVVLAIGAEGYHALAGLRWVDAIYNASMILTGMGPVDVLPNDGAKLFASAYAVVSGVVFLTAAAVLISPAVHRLLHVLHIEQGGRGR
jgi:hypothetical protein